VNDSTTASNRRRVAAPPGGVDNDYLHRVRGRVMAETPVSLLDRLRLAPDPASWRRLVELYTPLIRDWLRRHFLQDSDLDDVTQDVLGVLVRELPHFHHDLRPGAFRRWLRTVTANRLRTFWRARRARPLAQGDGDHDQMLAELEDPESRLSRLWDREHDRHVVRRLLQMLEPEFEGPTWQAFRLLVLEGKRTAEVACELGVTANAVRIAKSRVLSRLRQEVAGLID
jgi:RNA polymerase sigma-70 factor (ECF subfamily)